MARSVIRLSPKNERTTYLDNLDFFEGGGGGGGKKIQAEIRPESYIAWIVCWGVCDKIVLTKMHFSASA